MSNREQLKKWVHRFSGQRIGIVGDLLADTYLTGITERVSREAPVLIVRAEKEELVPGGAANVACNLAALGAKVDVVGVTGQDQAGEGLKAELKSRGINIQPVISDLNYGTVSKTRILAGAKHTLAQQVLRVDREPCKPPSATTMKKIVRQLLSLDRHVDGWIISDYGYHLINKDIIEIMQSVARQKPVLADSRYQIHRFAKLTAIKPNEQEALEAAGVTANTRDGLLKAADTLKKRVRTGAIIVTLGNQGMLVYESQKKYRFVPAIGSDQILDLTGAGDTAGATLLLSLSAGADFYQAATLANCAGSVVVMKYGCACCYPKELLKVIDEHIAQ
ncbi:MAG: bifunctional ADP-heptose synthase [Phycisphaerae bacterium]